MRTSTVLFLVLFLCLFSSFERGGRIRGFVREVRDGILEVTGGGRSSRSESRGAAALSADDSEVRRLRDELKETEERDELSDRTLRAIERSVRTLDDRIRKIEREMERQPSGAASLKPCLEQLLQQRLELCGERDQITRLRENLEGESIRLQAEIDLARIRGERRAVEEFLRVERGSPIERLSSEAR
ncbi:MAG: hypothetical protein HY812_15370 [Planctomycetes bacterium]|nr:hypothetical protein [Planctomycetota bacterium]